MKTFGGMLGGVPAATGPNPGTMVPKKMLQQAVRFSLGLPGVATLVIGPHTVQQLRENVRWVASYRPLSADERTTLLAQGKRLASQWGTHHGPAV
jgi:predicted aldo/keto reductase-like oxidoreductase